MVDLLVLPSPRGQILRVVKMVDLLPSSTSLILRVVKTVDHFPPVATYSQGGENGNPSLSPTGQIFRGVKMVKSPFTHLTVLYQGF